MRNAGFIVAMDGPAGVGKSTLAKRTAQAFSIAYLDTGAMFRTIALFFGEKNISLEEAALNRILQGFTFALSGFGATTCLMCNGRPVGDEIRSEEAGLAAARIAQSSEVRAFLKKAQQDLGQRFSLVAEGRDMGTEIFPNAPYKFFLDARPEVRARRRALQLRDMGHKADEREIAVQIARRDKEDRERPIAPLRPAPDALIIDTSDKNIEEVFQEIIKKINP